jgi:hypothetical protein
MAMDEVRGIAYISTAGAKPNFIGVWQHRPQAAPRRNSLNHESHFEKEVGGQKVYLATLNVSDAIVVTPTPE